MHTEKNNPGKVVDGDWHAFRKRARRTAFSPQEFSDIERTRYNLDSDDALSPAGITGQDNPDSYRGEATGPGEAPPREERNIRDDPWR